ncbi:Periplasmic thiol:disulfide interchange protein DsbA [Rubellimicrobium mesophilum DSM 19309]|uniref:Periplasmic thiol:disulfide interchange protein DsbA n=1 Tax=Rubellimicrobium mesophilum DSM 19309 TaxID=442562 RepID=A0A017HJZ3_9RHOB|nr:DsbA family protein [Rubellimicrobium mesophilum]EYD74676.1 Periplasmic thiol:disulfide interchange protein DsbA [Rubellimicrobium mesophilum DSM 19309]
MTRPVLLAALTSAVLGVATMLPLAAWAQEATDGAATQAPAATEGATTAAPAAEATGDQAAATDPATVTIPDMAEGAADAPVTIIEYGSFTCPHCAAWHHDVYPQLKTDYIDTGKVRFIFREVYFDRFGLWASMIARCGGEMRFFPIADMLYDQQRDWIGDQQPQTIADNLRRLGLSAGLGQDQLDACLKDETQAQSLVAWYQSNAETDGIDSTPTFLINGEKHSGEMPYDEFKGYVDAQLAAAQ